MNHSLEQAWSESSDRLRHFIRARVKDEQTADDILQDVFLRALTQIQTLRDQTKITGWLYQIARRATIDYYRRFQSTVEWDETIVAPDDADETLERELAECLPQWIEHLPVSYRDALVMSELEGVPQKQVAKKLGLSLSGAKSRVQRAREKIKQALLECCHFEFDRLGQIIDYRPKCDPQTCQSACC